jgi:hypothetical protein
MFPFLRSGVEATMKFYGWRATGVALGQVS